LLLTPDDETDIDHHVPLAKGGTNAITNLRLMHSTCNRDKAASL
jgi:5-methylcytosine-specific restriction endonuclease McrA